MAHALTRARQLCMMCPAGESKVVQFEMERGAAQVRQPRAHEAHAVPIPTPHSCIVLINFRPQGVLRQISQIEGAIAKFS